MVSAAPASAHCGSDTHRPHQDKYHGGGIRFWTNAPIRSGPHQGCTALDEALRSDGIDVHCRRTPDVTWYFVRNLTSKKNGWVRKVNLETPAGEPVPYC